MITDRMENGLEPGIELVRSSVPGKYRSTVDIYRRIFIDWLTSLRYVETYGEMDLKNYLVPQPDFFSVYELRGTVYPIRGEHFGHEYIIAWDGKKAIKTNFIRIIMNLDQVKLGIEEGFFYEDKPDVHTSFYITYTDNQYIFMDIFPLLRIVRIYGLRKDRLYTSSFKDFKAFSRFLKVSFFSFIHYIIMVRGANSEDGFVSFKVEGS